MSAVREASAHGERRERAQRGDERTTRAWWSSLPVHPLLFAAYPVLFLFGQNLVDAYLADLVEPLVSTVALALVATLILGAVLRDARKSALVVSAGVFAYFWFGDIAEATEPLGVGLWPTWGILAGIVAAGIIGAWRLGPRLGQATTGLNVISAVLVALTLVTIVPHQVTRLTAPGVSTAAAAPTELPAEEAPAGASVPDRDIYYLIFDRYGSDRALQLEYGIDNSEFTAWLGEQGFYVAEDSHANYVKTPISLASTLNLGFIDEVAERMGPMSDDYSPLFEMMDDHAVGRFMKEQGYEYVHIGSHYGPTRQSSIADLNTRSGDGTDFDRALSDNALLPWVETMEIPEGRESTRKERSAWRGYTYALLQWQEIRSMRDRPGQQFVFAHVLLPHPPLVFAADGSYSTDGDDLDARFAAQLEYTNSQIREIVSALLELPEEERPIIILQAEEGPFPERYGADEDGFDWTTATPEELETKFGILNAWYLPDGGTERLYPTISAVNTFRVLFNEVFGTDYELLPDRVWTSSSRLRPYDLQEVTDRLPSLRGEGRGS